MARSLSDQELFELDQECDRRVKELGAQGVQMFGVENHYWTTLLEMQLGERFLAEARERHLLWLKEQLDETEPQVRETLMRQRLGIANGHN